MRLDEQFRETDRLRTVGLINSDSHDSIIRPDGSHILMAYEKRAGATLPNPDPTKPDHPQIDAVIQEVSAEGAEVFTWNSGDHVDPMAETVNVADGDYAHVNSIQELPDGDILASFRHFSSIYRIDWNSDDGDGFSRGDIVWKLGGRHSDFTFLDDAATYEGAARPGPCAQHTASMLPNGNVLLFDNGSHEFFAAMCIDPSDPEGPPVNRAVSRATEYELDLSAGTARLVWSDALDRFTHFAGSAYRHPTNGSTLTGYAVDPGSLTRVSGPDGTTAWTLQDVGPETPGKYHGTYRSHWATMPDAHPPTATIESPTTSTTVAAGDALVLQARCTDKGGSALQDCAADGRRSGDLLDTSTVGTHTVTLTAIDGAGLTATDTVTYTVVPAEPPTAPASRADLQVRTPQGWIDVASYDSTRTARATIRLSRSRKVRLRLRVTNTGTTSERFALHGPGSNRWFVGRYVHDGVDVTRKVRRGTWRTPALAPGEATNLRLVVKARQRTQPGAVRRLRLVTTSTLTGSTTDAARVVVRVRRR